MFASKLSLAKWATFMLLASLTEQCDPHTMMLPKVIGVDGVWWRIEDSCSTRKVMYAANRKRSRLSGHMICLYRRSVADNWEIVGKNRD